MLIAISGSQGSGKSTVLNALEARGHHIVKRKTSRSILEDWGVTLQQVNDDPKLTTKFQYEITQRKCADEVHPAKSWTPLTFTERTHTDLFTYALVSLGKDNTYSAWLDEYYNTCLTYNQMYAQVFYLRAGFFVPEHDGTRGSNKHYSRMVDLTMLDYTKQMIHPSRLNIIETPDLEQRVNIIEAQAKLLIKEEY